jgi:hypothetical protein
MGFNGISSKTCFTAENRHYFKVLNFDKKLKIYKKVKIDDF